MLGNGRSRETLRYVLVAASSYPALNELEGKMLVVTTLLSRSEYYSPSAPLKCSHFSARRQLALLFLVGCYCMLAAKGEESNLAVKSAAQPRIVISVGPKRGVHSVAFSSNSKYLVIGSGTEAILWEVANGRQLRAFQQGHRSIVSWVTFSAGDARVVTGSLGDNTVRLWDAATGKQLDTFRGYPNDFSSVALSPDGRYLVSGILGDNVAHLWEPSSGQRVRGFKGHTDDVRAVAFSPNGKYVVTGSEDHTGRLWEVVSGKQVWVLEGHTDVVRAVAFSPDGLYAVTGSADNTARLWEVVTGKPVRSFEEHASYVKAVAFAPDGKHVMTISKMKVHLWDVFAGKEVQAFEGHTDDVQAVAFSPNGKHVVTGSSDRTARLWEVATGKQIRIFEQHTETVTSVAFSPDGRHVMTGSADKTARLWEVATGKPVRSFEKHESSVEAVAFAPDGKHVVTINGKKAHLWDLANGNEDSAFARSVGGAAYRVAFSPNGKYVVTDFVSNMPILWDAATQESVHYLRGHKETVSDMAFSPDSEHIVTGSLDHTARLWEVATGKQAQVFEGHTDYVLSVSFSPNGNYVVTSSSDGTTRWWDASSGKELTQLLSFTEGGWAAADPFGRFDSDNLEEIKGMHWIMADDPFHALPLEIFMRDLYEPKLLPRALAANEAVTTEDKEKYAFKPVRALQDLNRAQPSVTKLRIALGETPDTVDVDVEVTKGLYVNATNGKRQESDAYDLRLYRDGQLVAQSPEPKAGTPDGIADEELKRWQNDTLLSGRNDCQRVTERGDKKTVRFSNIKLPHRGEKEPVEFSAYAFNKDRVKGVEKKEPCPKEVCKAAATEPIRKAHLLAIGVNQSMLAKGQDLHYADDDARAMKDKLAPLLEQAKFVVDRPAVLITDKDPTKKQSHDATKTKIEQAIRDIAARSTPDDIVIVSFSGHGHAGKQGTFYLIPSEENSEQKVDQNSLDKNTHQLISADELTQWFRPVNAAEIVLIIDACYSAGALPEGFKPAPLGDRGLGQLAYDKRMRILVASQRNEAARERSDIGHGVLTYTLLTEALDQEKAAANNVITLEGWLEYPVRRVPAFFCEKTQGCGTNKSNEEEYEAQSSNVASRVSVQTPSLFDFTRANRKHGFVLKQVIPTKPSNSAPIR